MAFLPRVCAATALGTVLASAFILPGAAAAKGSAASAPQATIDTGRVSGSAIDGVASFKGIPFAKQPVGELRWRAPQQADGWTGVRPATEFGHDCMQKPFPSDAAPLGATPAEDCLTANVWAPAKAVGNSGRKLPVVVWIYGGGFVNGGSSPAVYDGAAFARQDVVFVSFNYRLGRFGFFAHPALSVEAGAAPTANFGLMDQVAALQWVKRNIGQFGGDPAQVTIMGESAGGLSVLELLASPLTEGLFDKAIIMSGGGRKLMGGMPLHSDDPAVTSAEQVGVNFAAGQGIGGTDAGALAALRKLPAEAVLGGLNLAFRGDPNKQEYVNGPVIDGKLVLSDTDVALRQGRMKIVPTIVGATSWDLGFATARTKDELFAQFGPDAGKARAVFDPAGDKPFEQVSGDVARDRLMIEPAQFVAGEIAEAGVKNGAKAWHYRFAYVAQSMRKEWPGAPHATDIPFFFDTVAAKYGKDLTSADAKAASLFNRYAVNFVKTGNPNGKGLPTWAPYARHGRGVQMLGPDASAASIEDPAADGLELVRALAERSTP
ncbi:carboxylesterase/lipase family protein [Novosphingobium guangzhouense]|uniref:Carboxylic ester hydrolase n=1 Tax=Novosphingobium guangzhouense TaxID=1850347 RepID=A0A2K2G3W1_9SPHN|nr:carboxylesterase family protein [Novosphingobium guangzhouense]PNU05735.1 hypothetical protein A8V01_15185 [Novosphingobium guangzhouense]